MRPFHGGLKGHGIFLHQWKGNRAIMKLDRRDYLVNSDGKTLKALDKVSPLAKKNLAIFRAPRDFVELHSRR